jgi:hypothetical protein
LCIGSQYYHQQHPWSKNAATVASFSHCKLSDMVIKIFDTAASIAGAHIFWCGTVYSSGSGDSKLLQVSAFGAARKMSIAEAMAYVETRQLAAPETTNAPEPAPDESPLAASRKPQGGASATPGRALNVELNRMLDSPTTQSWTNPWHHSLPMRMAEFAPMSELNPGPFKGEAEAETEAKTEEPVHAPLQESEP